LYVNPAITLYKGRRRPRVTNLVVALLTPDFLLWLGLIPHGPRCSTWRCGQVPQVRSAKTGRLKWDREAG
jgi:hypothetical protein